MIVYPANTRTDKKLSNTWFGFLGITLIIAAKTFYTPVYRLQFATRVRSELSGI